MKYLFFDIDGTLVSHQKGLLPSAKAAIEETRRQGNLCFIATGRHLSALGLLEGLQTDGIIYCNGAGIYYNNEILMTREIPHTICSQTVFQAEEREGAYSLMSSYVTFKNEAEMARMRKSIVFDHRFATFEEKLQAYGAKPFTEYRRQEILKIDIGFENESIMADFRKVMSPELKLVSTAGYHIEEGERSGEITRKDVSKGSAIQILIDKLGGSIADTYAFGDSGNDIEMIQMCHMGIAMGNGTDEVKKKAGFITKDINEDGLAYAMEQLGLVS